jgi:hypothetical protein
MKYSRNIIFIIIIIFLLVFSNILIVSSLTKNSYYRSNYSIEPFLVKIQNITGGFGVHAEIISGTNEDLNNVGWKISLSGGGLLLIGKKRSGIIETLYAGERIKIWSFVFGILGYGIFYKIRISIFFNGDEIEQRDALGQVFGPFVRNIFIDPPI